jgi:hypothetical protein
MRYGFVDDVYCLIILLLWKIENSTRRIQTRAELYYVLVNIANTYLKPLYIVNFEMLQMNVTFKLSSTSTESYTLRIACSVTTLCGVSQ